MIRLLDGPNFSGRSAWLEAKADSLPWPQSALLLCSGESALTGLATSVGEELAMSTDPLLDGANIACNDRREQPALELDLLLDRPMHVLSGGEMVRCALASALAQGVDELLVDVALEQLDTRWRSLLLAMFSGGSATVDLTICDNRLSLDERALAGETVRFTAADGGNTPAPTMDGEALANLLDERRCVAELSQVSFRYGRRLPYIFENLSLTLEPGHLYVLAGSNGAGKTTLLRLLSGTVVPTRGRIMFEGGQFVPRRRERFVALSFQNPDYQFSRGTIGSEIIESLGTEKAQVGLEPLAAHGGIPSALLDTNPFDCPFTFKKRLANLIAVVAGKPIIAFDEPTLGQDESYRAEFAKLAQSLTRRGRTILLISHDDNLLAALEDKIILGIGDGSVSLMDPRVTATS